MNNVNVNVFVLPWGTEIIICKFNRALDVSNSNYKVILFYHVFIKKDLLEIIFKDIDLNRIFGLEKYVYIKYDYNWLDMIIDGGLIHEFYA